MSEVSNDVRHTGGHRLDARELLDMAYGAGHRSSQVASRTDSLVPGTVLGHGATRRAPTIFCVVGVSFHRLH